ncbi:hypothetical protein TSAR_002005 [Trichomalopsis sarcophagae]|uniref:Uncharacterized protein n=1 Tax=Trichomalopsis sarcophagae TaxID=543379 RepID=A0A232ER00_9HYME|nr:hypothetical protein TSAR_002005 [Trichomalopsis sarcophagae]
MNAQQEVVNTLAVRQEELHTGLVNNRAKTLQIIDQRIASLAKGNSVSSAFSKMKLELTVFSGTTWEPTMRFLSKFVNYLEATGVSD